MRTDALWQDIAAYVDNQVAELSCMLKSQATEEHETSQQVDQAAMSEVAQVDLEWVNSVLFSGPLTPPAINEEKQCIDGLLTEEWT